MEKTLTVIFSVIAIIGSVIFLNISMTFGQKNMEGKNLYEDIEISSNSDILGELDLDEENEDMYTSEIIWNEKNVVIYSIYKEIPQGFIDYAMAINKSCEHIKKIVGADMSEADIYLRCEGYVNEEGAIGRIYYDIYFDETFVVSIDAVTGKIIGYLYNNNKVVTDQECIDNRIIIDRYTESKLGYGIDDYEENPEAVEELWSEMFAEAAPKYNEIAQRFVEDVLEIGDVEEVSENSTSKGVAADGYRYYYTVCCKMLNGDVLQVSVDQMTGDIQQYMYVE